jgi:nucleoside-diphosphate-sugar epimerase
VAKSKIVVTGGSGNLGRWTVQTLLDAGYEVLNLDVVPPRERICESWVADLSQTGDLYEACKGADAVIHLAAHQAPFMAADAEVFRNNMAATYNVFKAAGDMGVRRVVHASSVAAYGFTYAPKIWNPDYLPLDEEHPRTPKDPYSFSKVFGEQIADSYVGMFDMSVVSLRLAGVNFDLTYESLPARWEEPGARLGTFWSYVDVRDAAESCKLAIEADITGHEAFNIAAKNSRFQTPTTELVETYLPGTKIKDGAEGCWSGLDTSKARKILGYTDRYIWEDHIRPDGTLISK